MNIRRGLFRLWAALSLLWLGLSGVVAYFELLGSYQAAHARHTYELTSPNGIKYEIVSPAESAETAGLNEIINKLKGDVPAPPCKDGGQTCTPWDRKWAASDLKLLPGGQ
jgi:hypothetical protein